jgi:hypothetical protein
MPCHRSTQLDSSYPEHTLVKNRVPWTEVKRCFRAVVAVVHSPNSLVPLKPEGKSMLQVDQLLLSKL